MKTLLEEIDSFLSFSDFAEGTKRIYSKKLKEFTKYLSNITCTNEVEIHLKKIFVVTDIKDEIVTYRPINASIVDQFIISNLSKGPSWILTTKKSLGSFFKYLYRKYDFNNIMKNLSFDFRSVHQHKKPVRILSRHELLKFFHSIISHSRNLEQDLFVFTILITTGCRISELINLKIQDINWDEGTIILPETKNKVQRMIILRPELINAISIYIEQNNLNIDDHLFSINYYKVRSVLKLYLGKANLPSVTIHSLRHSFATLMYESDCDISFIKQILGHSGIEITREYIHPHFIRNINIKNKENLYVFEKFKINTNM
ncbi:site-specific integrase [Bacillus sp. N1-1]|uniref:tyrosine-type recombinase/integrase n=1 Tax=Bacillus sp. N1-1 TaxID=2682541 RepID=UPI001317144E|nr:site-specific integrase [Bacillus sp. N1-1]QHA93125.1 tyrosine-type recombinase/integrase [Bacillus sp. N1-1]